MISYNEKGINKGYGASVTINVFGIKELDENLKMLSKSLRDQVLRAGMVKAAQPLIKAAKDKAPKSEKDEWISIHRHWTKKGGFREIERKHKPGDLRRSIGVKPVKGYPPAVFVGPNRGAGKKYDAWYAHFVEFGTKKMPQHAFMRPAYDSTKGQVIEELRKYLEGYVMGLNFKT